MSTIRIGFIGYGSIGRVHAMAYRSIPFHYGLPASSVQIVGVATSRMETAERAAQEIGCDYWTDDYHQLLARDGIDMIDINTPNNTHLEIALATAAAGKHIYCEKPLAASADEGRQIVDAVSAAGVKNQMTFNFRFFPAVMRAQQLISEGFLGRIYSFRGRYYRSSYIDPQRPTSWKLTRAGSGGGGALFDIGSHVLDLIYSLLGDYGSVQATLDTVIKERPQAAGSDVMVPVDVDDIALLHLRLADGTLGLVEASRLGTGITNEIVVEVYGEKGALRINLLDPNWLEVYDTRDDDQPIGGMSGFRRVQTVQRYPGQKSPDWTMAPDFVRVHAECQYQFIKAIWEDGPAQPSIADGQHIQAVMEAALRSSDEQRWVNVSEV